MITRMKKINNAKAVQLALFREYGFQPCLKEEKKMDWKKIFAACETIEELKKAFKKACMSCHPDKGGTAAEFKAMSAVSTSAPPNLPKPKAARSGSATRKPTAHIKRPPKFWPNRRNLPKSWPC